MRDMEMRDMDKMDNAIAALFLDYSCRKLESMTDHLRVCLGKLTDGQIWERHGAHENSVGMLHLCGNMRQWVSPGWAELWMCGGGTRSSAPKGGMDGEELMGRFSVTVDEALR
jgi:hypothetical protein